MESERAEETGKKKRWTVEEKARVVCRSLKDHVGLADLAEETGTSPGLILQLAKQALEGLLSRPFPGRPIARGKSFTGRFSNKKTGSESLIRCQRISTEKLTLKKSLGSSHRDPHRPGNDGGNPEDRDVS